MATRQARKALHAGTTEDGALFVMFHDGSRLILTHGPDGAVYMEGGHKMAEQAPAKVQRTAEEQKAHKAAMRKARRERRKAAKAGQGGSV